MDPRTKDKMREILERFAAGESPVDVAYRPKLQLSTYETIEMLAYLFTLCKRLPADLLPQPSEAPVDRSPASGRWEAVRQPSEHGEMWCVRWTVPTDAGMFIVVRHYPDEEGGEKLATEKASAFNARGYHPDELVSFNLCSQTATPVKPNVQPGKWIAAQDFDGLMWRVGWSIPDANGNHLWMRHYPTSENGEHFAKKSAEEFNREGIRPEDCLTFPLQDS